MNPLLRSFAALALVVTALSACSDDGGVTTTSESVTTSGNPSTTAVSGDFVFGTGELPESFPEDFPVANGAVIGGTLVNTVTGFTEVAFTVPADVDIAALFFEQNLQARGYEYGGAKTGEARWNLTFAKDGVSGTIDISMVNAGVSRATVTIPGDG